MKSYLLAMGQFLTDPRLWKVMFWCVLLSLTLFALLMTGVGLGLQWLAEQWQTAGWLQRLTQWSSWGAAFVVTLILFPTLFGVIGGFFYETVADAVDSRHYPKLPPADGAPLLVSLKSGLKYFVLMLLLNALALPVYLTLLIVAGTGLGLYIVVNGILFGREHYDAVALRRRTPEDARNWRRANRPRLFFSGVLTALLGLVPFLNLVAPLFGVAAMTHEVNRSLDAGPPIPVAPPLPPV